MPANKRTVILKLPYKERENWRISACEILEKFNRRAQFIDIVTFIEHQDKIVTDPSFGDIQNTLLPTANKNVNKTAKVQRGPFCNYCTNKGKHSHTSHTNICISRSR